MKKTLSVLVFLFVSILGYGQTDFNTKTIHVFVALCDNANQGIVPVPSKLGNGQDPNNNLYWGALYGVKTYLKRSKDWTLISVKKNPKEHVLERVFFKHNSSNTYLLADAYDGKYIKQSIIDFLEASAGRNSVEYKKKQFGGKSKLLAYVGHDGLMEFDVTGEFSPLNKEKRDAIILACLSKSYFKPFLTTTKANPLVWSTGLMSPEAYTLKWAIDGWIQGETDTQIRERAAQAYHKYQKCGMNGARRLLVTGY